VEFEASLNIMERTLQAAIIPSVALVGEVAAGLDFFVVQGKFGSRLTLMRTFIIPTGTLIAGDGGAQACLTIDLKIEPLVSHFLCCLLISGTVLTLGLLYVVLSMSTDGGSVCCLSSKLWYLMQPVRSCAHYLFVCVGFLLRYYHPPVLRRRLHTRLRSYSFALVLPLVRCMDA